jgi:hypothetical protein
MASALSASFAAGNRSLLLGKSFVGDNQQQQQGRNQANVFGHRARCEVQQQQQQQQQQQGKMSSSLVDHHHHHRHFVLSRREAVRSVLVAAGGVGTAALWSCWTPFMASALLEADDDDALLEKVKEDKKKRIQRRASAINSFKKETESVQAAVYKLSKAGQAIDGSDFSTATSVLGSTSDNDWIKDVKDALSKVSANSEERKEADVFSSALASLQSAVVKQDAESSKSAFVVSASALEKWSTLTGLSEQIKGL